MQKERMQAREAYVKKAAEEGKTYQQVAEELKIRKKTLLQFCSSRKLKLKSSRDQSGALNPNWRGGDSRSTVNRTTKRVLTSAGVDLHTCQRCGFYRETPLPRHHKDRNRNNNDISNLEVLCVSCHNKEHMGEKLRTPGGKFI